ncbi:hypothetical protein NBRC10512_005064 [Rhodotorula toruloides]|uniref:Fumarylacetoacetase n=2 Tax=Rhodotorula toruloides TaxID=5286 RepID=A0A061B157_RHOTO|nr:fumarylacetoacetase [Rhodotorula toruloides NP11]EMS24048.1 fumarylacetoacetase [Rhodotorula toruloides NP11]KAJ8293262.1 Fumarylacetoacetase [Rhodotorula toruloides]CDR41373.1 RHTO0S06e01244g1_1 [Rhodotorula toruloides]
MQSWLDIPADSHFSLANVPFGIISHAGSGGARVGATRLGDWAVDLSVPEAAGLLAEAFEQKETSFFAKPTLNDFAGLPARIRQNVRLAIQSLFRSNSSLPDDLHSRAVLTLDSVETHLPFSIPDFVDYSIFPAHALGAGRAIFGPQNQMPPAWNALPMAYNGRAGTVSVKNEIVRPQGQTRAFSAAREVSVGSCQALDWEFEVGAFVAEPTQDGTVLTPSTATSHLFGFVLLNDWSARDVQAFEMVPLGPFNGKSFATTISPWVVVPEALEPFATVKPPRLEGTAFEEPEYLREKEGAKTNYDIECTTTLHLASNPSTAEPVAKANFAQAFWSFPQLLTYQTYSGARLQTGDLLGSGTISNMGDRSQGCMLELSQGGKVPLKIGGEERRWIEDGDEVVFSAVAGEEGGKVGFGELRGKVLPTSTLRMA